MTTAHDPDIAAIAENVAEEAFRELQLGDATMTRAVRDAASDAKVALADIMSAGRQAERDLAELHAKRDLVPAQGLKRLRQETLSEAQSRASEADRRVGRALETLEAELVAAALPRIDSVRERLARDELLLAMGPAQGDSAVARAMRIAQHGATEAVAVMLNTSYGRTLLESRGVPNPEAALSPVRRVAASVAAERGTTAREILASKALERLGKLGAAKGAAGAYVIGIVRKAGG